MATAYPADSTEPRTPPPCQSALVQPDSALPLSLHSELLKSTFHPRPSQRISESHMILGRPDLRFLNNSPSPRQPGVAPATDDRSTLPFNGGRLPLPPLCWGYHKVGVQELLAIPRPQQAARRYRLNLPRHHPLLSAHPSDTPNVGPMRTYVPSYGRRVQPYSPTLLPALPVAGSSSSDVGSSLPRQYNPGPLHFATLEATYRHDREPALPLTPQHRHVSTARAPPLPAWSAAPPTAAASSRSQQNHHLPPRHLPPPGYDRTTPIPVDTHPFGSSPRDHYSRPRVLHCHVHQTGWDYLDDRETVMHSRANETRTTYPDLESYQFPARRNYTPPPQLPSEPKAARSNDKLARHEPAIGSLVDIQSRIEAAHERWGRDNSGDED